MYSTHNEGKSVVAERFIRTFSNNTYHNTTKMKPIDVGHDSFAKYNEESNEKDPKFKVGDDVRFQSTKMPFLKDMLLNGVRFLL